MLPETMLEYLTLREFMNNNVPCEWENFYQNGSMKAWYSNGEYITIDLIEVKKRLTELEKLIINPYVIDNTL